MVAGVTGRSAIEGCINAAELAAGGKAGVSGAALADVAAKPACLNSTDFKCPRVAMIQSVSPKGVATAVFRNPIFISQHIGEANRSPLVRRVGCSKLLKRRKMNSMTSRDLEQEPMNEFQLRHRVPK